MSVSLKILVTSLALGFAGSAYANCADELARLEGVTSDPATDMATADGATAPAHDNKIAKDGTTAPLESEPGTSTDTAMSGQDVAAQQEGAPTAAEEAAMPASDHDEAIEDARAAIAKGDEAACLEAIGRAS